MSSFEPPPPGPDSPDDSGSPGDRPGEILPPIDEAMSGGLPDPTAPQDPDVPQSMEKLDSRTVTYWMLSGLASAIFPFGILFGGSWFALYKWPETQVWVLPLAIGLGVLYVLYVLIYPALAYSRWRFFVDAELLVARHGVVFHEEKYIPISRLQHVDLHRGPIERMFGLATLVVFTAGTEGAHFGLPGLAVERAQVLRDMILEARGDDVV